MAKSTVGEQGGFLPDADAVDAMKVMFFSGAFVAYYKALEVGAPIARSLVIAGTNLAADLEKRSEPDPPKPDDAGRSFYELSKTEKKIFVVGTVVGLNPIVGAQSVAAYRAGKGIIKPGK